MKHCLARAAWLSGIALAGASAAPACAADPPDADALVKKLTADSPRDALGASFVLDAMLRNHDKSAEDTAAKVLALKEQVVKDKDVLALFNDDLAKEPTTAARLLVFIVRSQAFVKQNKKGAVVVGRLASEDGKAELEDVMAQMPIFPGGWFATDIGDFDHPLSFRTPGYAALDVPLSGKSGDLVSVGKCILKPIGKDDAAELKGTVVLDGGKEVEATVTLSLSVPPINTASGGYSPRAHWPQGDKHAVSKTGEFEVEGLSPLTYQMNVTAEGHTPYRKVVTLKPGEEKDLGEIRLQTTDVGAYIGKAAPKTDKLTWEKDYAAALARADKEKRPILVMETATWCGWCKKLEADTLDDPWVRYALSDYVLVKAFEDKEVEGKYGCEGYPTLIFTDSSGKKMHQSVGYMATAPFLEQVARADQKLGVALPAELKALADKKVITLDAGGAPATATQEPDKNDGELKWAKGVAEDFLAALHKSDQAQAELLMTRQLAATVENDANWLSNFANAGFTLGASATIAEESLSPDKDEAVFHGRLDGHARLDERTDHLTPVQSRFSIRLTKDKESGKWRVSFFTYADPTPVEKKP